MKLKRGTFAATFFLARLAAMELEGVVLEEIWGRLCFALMAREIRISPAAPMIIVAAITEMANQAGNEPRPSLEIASKWFDRASIALALSLLVGFASTVVIIWLGIVKEHHWDFARELSNERIGHLFKEGEQLKKDAEVLRKETAEAKARGAEAEARAEQVRLSFELLQKPRQFAMNTDEFKAQLKDKPPVPVKVRYDPSVYDAADLARHIGFIIQDIGWGFDWDHGLEEFIPPVDSFVSTSNFAGVEVIYGEGAEVTGTAFNEAFLRSGASHLVKFGPADAASAVPKGTVRITIGQKPPFWIRAPTTKP